MKNEKRYIPDFDWAKLIGSVLVAVLKKVGLVSSVYDMDALGEDEQSGFLGKIAEKIDVLVVDPKTKQPLPDGQTGEICVHSSMHMNGYLADERSSVYLRHGEKIYLRTGDLGYRRGAELYMAGRYDHPQRRKHPPGGDRSGGADVSRSQRSGGMRTAL